MTIDTLKTAISRRPFEPFRVVTSSGETYNVRHPENAWLYKNGLIVAHGGVNGGLAEHYADIALLHITAVEKITTGRNGRPAARKRRR